MWLRDAVKMEVHSERLQSSTSLHFDEQIQEGGECFSLFDAGCSDIDDHMYLQQSGF